MTSSPLLGSESHVTGELASARLSTLCKLLCSPSPTISRFVREGTVRLSSGRLATINHGLGGSNHHGPSCAREECDYLMERDAVSSFIHRAGSSCPSIPHYLTVLSEACLASIRPAACKGLCLRGLSGFLPRFVSTRGGALIRGTRLFGRVFFRRYHFGVRSRPGKVSSCLIFGLLGSNGKSVVSFTALCATLTLSYKLSIYPIPTRRKKFELFCVRGGVPLFFISLRRRNAVYPSERPRFIRASGSVVHFCFVDLCYSRVEVGCEVSPTAVFQTKVGLF